MTNQTRNLSQAQEAILMQQSLTPLGHTPIDRYAELLAMKMGMLRSVSRAEFMYFEPQVNFKERFVSWLEEHGWILVRDDYHLGDSEDEYDHSHLSGLYVTGDQNMLLRFTLTKHRLAPAIYTRDIEAAEAILEAMGIEFPSNERPEAEDDKVDVHFWNMGQYGPECNIQSLECPKWDEISDNYTNDVVTKLNEIMGHEPDRAGIILWTGVPGTGKTTALRALMQEWRDYSSAHVIVDPEVLLNQPSYMQHFLVQAEGADSLLLVMEDSGEMISSDAKDRVGQGLSRLLNMTDGLLGQGRKVIILITTNEPQEALHAAITRPGRGLQNLDFVALDEAEVQRWCENKNIDPPADCDGSIAALYDHLRKS